MATNFGSRSKPFLGRKIDVFWFMDCNNQKHICTMFNPARHLDLTVIGISTTFILGMISAKTTQQITSRFKYENPPPRKALIASLPTKN